MEAYRKVAERNWQAEKPTTWAREEKKKQENLWEGRQEC